MIHTGHTGHCICEQHEKSFRNLPAPAMPAADDPMLDTGAPHHLILVPSSSPSPPLPRPLVAARLHQHTPRPAHHAPLSICQSAYRHLGLDTWHTATLASTSVPMPVSAAPTQPLARPPSQRFAAPSLPHCTPQYQHVGTTAQRYQHTGTTAAKQCCSPNSIASHAKPGTEPGVPNQGLNQAELKGAEPGG